MKERGKRILCMGLAALLTVSSVPEMTVWAEEVVTPGEVVAEEITTPEEAEQPVVEDQVSGTGDTSEDGLFEYRDLGDGTIRITKYTRRDSVIVIPDEIDGKKVVEIAQDVFQVRPELRSIKLPAGLKSIDSFAFNACSGLTSIEIPESVTSLGNGAFYDCHGLTEIKIPAGLTSIAYDAFVSCTSLMNITVDENNPAYCSVDGVLFNKAKTMLVRYPSGRTGEYKVPSGVTILEDGAFCLCEDLTEIEIPDTVTQIGYGVFEGCVGLTSVKLPEGVGAITDYAFADCSGLTEIEIPDTVWYIGDGAFESCDKLTSVKLPSKLTTIKGGAFYGCNRLTSMAIPAGVTDIDSGAWQACTAMTSLSVAEGNTSFSVKDNVLFNKDQSTLIYCPIGKSGAYQIPQGVTTISTGAFLDCSNLTSITLPEGLKIIGRSAFACCGGLTEMTIPVGVTDIDEGAFAGCSSLMRISIDEQNPNYSTVDGVLFNKDQTRILSCPGAKTGVYELPETVNYIPDFAFYGCGKLTGIQIPDEVTHLCYNAFFGCSSLTELKLPSSLKYMGTQVFGECSSLTALYIDEQNQKYSTEDGVLFNKAKTQLLFCPTGKAGEYIIPSEVSRIEEGAFAGCKKLTSVTLPSGIEGISYDTFKGCSGLTKMMIPESVKYIGWHAFEDCSSLTDIELSTGLIGSEAFAGCSSLTRIKIPAGITCIAYGAFSGCSNLTDIIVDEQNPNYSSTDGVLFDKTGTKLMLCPAGKKGDYQIPDGVKNIKSGAFSGCDGLTKITIPSGVTGIGGSVFEGCTNLEIECDENSYAYSYIKKNNLPTRKTFTITFSAEGGTGLSQTSRTVKEGEAFGTLPTVTRTGYIFKGWFTQKTGGTAVTKDTKAASNMTLYAQWEKEKPSISKAVVTLSATKIAYDGKAKKPSVKSVTLSGKKLKAGTDYTVTYKNNKNIGKASVIITGKGTYAGSVTKTFTIYVKKGTTVTSGACKYKFTSTSGVAFAGIKSTKTTKVVIPKTVKIGGKTFKVTSIAKKALYNKSKVKSVTIGENVKTIGASAFQNCKKLSTITIKTTKLKSAGKNTFKGIKATAKIKVPSKKLKAYKKILKNKGQGSKVKIVKK